MEKDVKTMDKSIQIIIDDDGNKIAIINDIKFQSRRGVDWKDVEEHLKEYIGGHYKIMETSETIFIGSDFPDEFSHSNDTRGLKGANRKAKANIISAIGALIKIATSRMEYPDYKEKHGSKAKYGWYGYSTRFGIPVYDAQGNLERYNIFSTRMLVRRDEDGKLYLYDFVRTKKETSRPHKQ